MQPSPRADTSKLLFPSLRFCIISPKSSVKSFLLRGLVLLVANLFHPFDGLAVKVFQDGDVRHGRGWSGAVPMLLTRRAPDHIARPNFFFRATFALHPPKSGSDDQGLPERMRVPCCPRAGLERDTDAEHARRIGCLEQWVNAYRAGKILVRSFAGGL